MRQYNLPRKRRQKGFTLAEVLFGLVIIIAGAMVSFTAFYQANSSLEGKEAQDQTTQLLGAVRKVYPGPSYNGVSATDLVNRGVAPQSMVNGSNLVNTYGGKVTLAPVSVASGTDNAVVITFPHVPRAECNLIIAQTHSLFGRVVVGSTSVKDEFAATPSAFNSARMETACDNERNSIAFTMAG